MSKPKTDQQLMDVLERIATALETIAGAVDGDEGELNVYVRSETEDEDEDEDEEDGDDAEAEAEEQDLEAAAG